MSTPLRRSIAQAPTVSIRQSVLHHTLQCVLNTVRCSSWLRCSGYLWTVLFIGASGVLAAQQAGSLLPSPLFFSDRSEKNLPNSLLPTAVESQTLLQPGLSGAALPPRISLEGRKLLELHFAEELQKTRSPRKRQTHRKVAREELLNDELRRILQRVTPLSLDSSATSDLANNSAGPRSRSFRHLAWNDRNTEQKAQTTQQQRIQKSYGVLLEPRRGRSFRDGKLAFARKQYRLASEIMIESRYTAEAVGDPDYLNWLFKSLLAARSFDTIPHFLKLYHLQPDILRLGKGERDAELYYLLGRYHFARGELILSRKILIDYLHQFPGSHYIPQTYYWIARGLELEGYLEEARTVYLLVVSYFSRHFLHGLSKYKAGTISLYLLKKQAEDFLRARGVDWES